MEGRTEGRIVLCSTFILLMYTWIFYTQATQNMYLNNIQQCNIELVQYFWLREIFSFLSSTFFGLVSFWFFFGSALTCICSFSMAIYKKYSHRAKISEGHSESWHVGRNGTLKFCLQDNWRANLFNLLNNCLQWWRYKIISCLFINNMK